MFWAFSLVRVSGSPVNLSAAFLARGAEIPHCLPHMAPLTSCSGRAPCRSAVAEALVPHSASSVGVCVWCGGGEGRCVTVRQRPPWFPPLPSLTPPWWGFGVFVTTGGLWVESLVCFVAFGQTRVVISKAFGLAGLPLSWISCSICSRDLLGLFWSVPVGVSGFADFPLQTWMDEATSKLTELISMWFLGS